MHKKGNIYFVNTANIENTVNTANNKNNIVIIYLTLRIGFFIVGRIHSTNRFSKHTGWRCRWNIKKGLCRLFQMQLIYSIFLVTTILMKINTAAQTTKVTLELMKVRLMRCLRKRGKEKIIQDGQRQNKSKLKRR